MSSFVLQIIPRVTGRSSVRFLRERMWPDLSRTTCHVSVTLPFSVGEMALHRDEESHSVFASTASFSDPPDFSSQLCSAVVLGTA